ncbi:hypothetical protein ACR8AL_09160 [Clavibacter sepedonicus]|uniref:Membrane protein n=1 Tax=Clavibacter sepedonicus TaxID=31964 RepID=B0RJ22_CLASE|nr:MULTISPECIES: hypothetical protein [Clavibacter]MBD5382712.1 hypothetical protein [Clavibacter sp.]OQJ45087.1 hypothetical protein B5P19_15985 [Clavibacter sepedonicus]OQJ50890.1 hypothetical protein B5P20_15765 [Clavibacter sepedonicus]UUK67308.1 hypothetical protein LRE50_16240 [Clavibacter sepedonicus]CAQ03211.1 putative membrane protein [Clavibacter sepedonicus]
MPSPRRRLNFKLTRFAVFGLLASTLGIVCMVRFLTSENKTFLAADLVLVVSGQIGLWVQNLKRMRQEDAKWSKRE